MKKIKYQNASIINSRDKDIYLLDILVLLKYSFVDLSIQNLRSSKIYIAFLDPNFHEFII
jgi:hypothetical protein